MQIHLKDIRLKLCEGSFHEDNNKKNIQYIPLVNAEVKIWNRDKTKVLYHNTASDNGVLEFSNCEIEDDEFALYLEIKHQDFEETPIGGNLYVRKGMENQENRIYFKRIKLRLKHAPFASLQNPKKFYQALNPSNKYRKGYAEGDKENDWVAGSPGRPLSTCSAPSTHSRTQSCAAWWVAHCCLSSPLSRWRRAREAGSASLRSGSCAKASTADWTAASVASLPAVGTGKARASTVG